MNIGSENAPFVAVKVLCSSQQTACFTVSSSYSLFWNDLSKPVNNSDTEQKHKGLYNVEFYVVESVLFSVCLYDAHKMSHGSVFSPDHLYHCKLLGAYTRMNLA